MRFSCISPEKDKSDNEFYYECAHRTFKTFHQSFDRVEGKYLDFIEKIDDPILRHIFLYFIQYYIDGHYYFNDSKSDFRNTACTYLRNWLQERKDLFTYGEKCNTKKYLWNNTFTTLLDMLKKDHTLTNNSEKKLWCDKIPLSQTTNYPDALTSPNCEESTSQKPSIADPCPQPVETNCKCLPNEVPVISLLSDQAPEKDPTKNIAVTSGFTAVGTLGTLFFLYRFTPMASWFRRPGMSNIGTGLYMDQGGADSFLRMQGGDGGNNLFYHPSV